MYEIGVVKPHIGNGAYGPVYGDEYEESCYLEPGYKLVLNQRGEEVVSDLWGVFRAESPIAVNDAFVWNGRTYRVINVQQLRNKGQTHHIEVSFGSSVQ
jgi:hypothetical protein